MAQDLKTVNPVQEPASIIVSEHVEAKKNGKIRKQLYKSFLDDTSDGDHQEVVRFLDGMQPSIQTIKDFERRNAVHLACLNGKLDILKTLLAQLRKDDKGMKKCLTAKDKYGNTPLILSCKNKHNDMRVTIKIVERIVSELQRVIPDNKELKKCVQSTSQTQKWSALHWAVRTANSRAVEVLTPFSNPEQVDAMKRSALSLAGSLYKEEFEKISVSEDGGDLSIIQKFPSIIENLVTATLNGIQRDDVVESIIKNRRGLVQECLLWSSMAGLFSIFKDCLDQSKTKIFDSILPTDPGQVSCSELLHGYSAFHLSAMTGRHDLLHHMIDTCKHRDSLINCRDEIGCTPLQYAIKVANSKRAMVVMPAANVNTVKLLLEMKANPFGPRDQFNFRPIDYAKEEVSRHLLEIPEVKQMDWFYGNMVRLQSSDPNKEKYAWKPGQRVLHKSRGAGSLTKFDEQGRMVVYFSEEGESHRYRPHNWYKLQALDEEGHVVKKAKSHQFQTAQRKVKWRTDLVLKFRGSGVQENGNHVVSRQERTGKTIKQMLAGIFPVVEFDGNEGDHDTTIPDYYLLIRADERDIVKVADRLAARVKTITHSGRDEFELVNSHCYMPFYKSDVVGLLMQAINEVLNLSDQERLGFMEAPFGIHETRPQDDINNLLTNTRCMYPMGNMGPYLREGPEIQYPELDLILYYLGEKVALYFGFLSFYTSWLFLLTIPSLCVLVYSLSLAIYCFPSYVEYSSLLQQNYSVNWTVDYSRAHAYDTSYPNCTFLDAGGLLTKSFASWNVPLLSIVVCIWTTVFVERWKRKQSELVCVWDAYVEDHTEFVRPQFLGDEQKDYATGSMKKTYPRGKATLRLLSFLPIAFVMSLLIILSVILVTLFDYVFMDCRELLGFQYDACNSQDKLQESHYYVFLGLSSLSSGILVYCLNALYAIVAEKLNDLQNHRTDEEHERGLIWKIFIFQLANSFVSPLFALCFREDFVRTMCTVASIMICKMIGDQLFESAIPSLCSNCNAAKALALLENEDGEKTYTLRFAKPNKQIELPTDEDISKILENDSLDDDTETSDEYLEMMVQLGFVVFWTGLCPFVPFLAFINNLIEIRGDAKKFVYQAKRAFPIKVENIGDFEALMQLISYMGMVVSIFALWWSWTELDVIANEVSTIWNNLVNPESSADYALPNVIQYQEGNAPTPVMIKLVIVVAIEHLFLGIKLVIDIAMGDEADWVVAKREKIAYRKELARNNVKSGSNATHTIAKGSKDALSESDFGIAEKTIDKVMGKLNRIRSLEKSRKFRIKRVVFVSAIDRKLYNTYKRRMQRQGRHVVDILEFVMALALQQAFRCYMARKIVQKKREESVMPPPVPPVTTEEHQTFVETKEE